MRIGASGLRSSWAEHRQELVLAAVGLLQLLLGPLPVGDVGGRDGDAVIQLDRRDVEPAEIPVPSYRCSNSWDWPVSTTRT